MYLPISVSSQAQIFLYSIIGGMIIAFIYDAFRVKRKAIRTSAFIIYFEDLIYWFIVSIVMFAVVYYSNEGEIRGYIFIGTALGAILYFLLFSRVVMNSALLVIKIVCKVFSFIWTVISCPFKLIFKVLAIPARFLAKMSKRTFKGARQIGRSRFSKVTVWKKMFKNIRKKI
jgi:spore cortex biosynthesis protein YabQ